MVTPQRSVLLLGGAGLPTWVWDEVRDLLDVDCVVVPRPPRHESAPLAAYVDAALSAAPAGELAVVAHSSGGVVGAEVVRRDAGRVTSFLGISAVVPAPGASFVSAMPAPNRWLLGAALRLAGTRPPERAVRRGLGAGLEDELVDRLVADLATESKGLFLDRTGERSWPVRRGYVATTQDRELPPVLQRRFAGTLGAAWSREVPTGHLPMLEEPGTTAAAIADFLAG